jgi:hypothetical protein
MSCTNGPTASKKLRNSRALSETGKVSLLGIPLDPNDMLCRILAAARNFVALAVLGRFEGLGRAPVGVLECFRPCVVDVVTDVLNNHGLPPK